MHRTDVLMKSCNGSPPEARGLRPSCLPGLSITSQLATGLDPQTGSVTVLMVWRLKCSCWSFHSPHSWKPLWCCHVSDPHPGRAHLRHPSETILSSFSHVTSPCFTSKYMHIHRAYMPTHYTHINYTLGMQYRWWRLDFSLDRRKLPVT